MARPTEGNYICWEREPSFEFHLEQEQNHEPFNLELDRFLYERQLDQEFNENYPDFEPELDQEFHLHNGTWQVIEYELDLERQRIVLENTETHERVTIRRGSTQSIFQDIFLEAPVTRSHFIKEKQEPVMDRKYPHHCYNFNCRKKLHFSEVLEANLFTIRDNNGWLYHHRKYDLEKYKQIKKLWKSKYVQFLCCSCYICNISIGE